MNIKMCVLLPVIALSLFCSECGFSLSTEDKVKFEELKREIVAVEQSKPNSIELSEAYLDLGRFYVGNLKDLKGSVQYFEKGKNTGPQISLERASNACFLAACEFKFKKYKQAIRHFFESYEISQSCLNKESDLLLTHPKYSKEPKWQCLFQIKGFIDGTIQAQLDPEDAEKFLLQLIEEFKKENQANSLVLAHEVLYGHYKQQNKIDEALAQLEKIKTLTNKVDYVKLAHSYEKNSEWNKALECYEKALLDPSASKGFIYIGIGICSSRLQEFERAIEAYANAHKFYLETRDFTEVANTQNSLGYCYFLKGDYNLAIAKTEEALKILIENKVTDLSCYYAVYDSLACCYEANGQLELAEKHYINSIGVGRVISMNDRDYALKFVSLSNVYIQQNRIEDARKHLKVALEYLKADKDVDLIEKINNNLNSTPVVIPRVDQYKK